MTRLALTENRLRQGVRRCLIRFWPTKAQLKRIEPFFPRTRDIPHVDDRRVVGGIVHVIRNGLRWRERPRSMDPTRRSTTGSFAGLAGIFDQIFANLAAESGPPDRMRIRQHAS